MAANTDAAGGFSALIGLMSVVSVWPRQSGAHRRAARFSALIGLMSVVSRMCPAPLRRSGMTGFSALIGLMSVVSNPFLGAHARTCAPAVSVPLSGSCLS